MIKTKKELKAEIKTMADHFDLILVEQIEEDIKLSEQSEELRKNGFSDEDIATIKKSWGNSIELPK